MKLLLPEPGSGSGYVLEDLQGMTAADGTLVKEMAVPAGLFFLQRAFEDKTPTYKLEEGNEGMAPCSLYDRLFTLVEDKTSRKTRKRAKKSSAKKKRQTKKNN